MRQNSPRKTVITARSLFVVCAWIMAIGWILSVPNDEHSAEAKERTINTLNTALKLMRLLTSETLAGRNDVPESLSELRAFAMVKGVNFHTFDGFGHRLEYVRLSPRHYVLRSFGKDSVQNTPGSDLDPSVAKWTKLPSSTPLYRYQSEPHAALYPSPLILGSTSPNIKWHAQIYLDAYAGKRQLLVRNRVRKSMFLIAPHDLVEEFLWLPDSRHVVYTASSSLRYQDGIYLWDLEEDKTVNLLDFLSKDIKKVISDRDDRFYLSLAGIAMEGQQVLAYISPHSDIGLNPKSFLSTENLYGFKLPPEGNSKLEIAVEQIRTDEPVSALDAPVAVMENIFGQTLDDQVYRDWSALAVNGDIETVISSWQEFAEYNAKSTILPYCLWMLSSMYNDAHAVLEKSSPKEAEVLRSYGAELARTLANQNMGPAYLQAFGAFVYESLTSNVPLPYTIANFSAKRSKP